MIKILIMVQYCFREYSKYENDISTDARYVRCLVRVLTNDTWTRILISKILLPAQNSAIKTETTAGTPPKGFNMWSNFPQKMCNEEEVIYLWKREMHAKQSVCSLSIKSVEHWGILGCSPSAQLIPALMQNSLSEHYHIFLVEGIPAINSQS